MHERISYLTTPHSEQPVPGTLVQRNGIGGIDGIGDTVFPHSGAPIVGGPFSVPVLQTVIAATPAAVTPNVDFLYPTFLPAEHTVIHLDVQVTTADILALGNLVVYANDETGSHYYPTTRLAQVAFNFGALGFRGGVVAFTPPLDGLYWIGVNVTNAAGAAWGTNNPIVAVVPNFGYDAAGGIVTGFAQARVGAFPATYPAGLTAITLPLPLLFYQFVQTT